MAVGKIAPFDMDKDCWDLYVERLEQYFIANTVSESVKVATLITVVGRDAYELMVNLCTPARPATKTFDQLKAIMKSHLQPKPSVLAERFKFRQRRQASDESIAEYVAALKKMSMTCNFGADSLQDNLRDQFVCGLSKDVIRQRLFAEEEITFEKAFKLAVTIDSAETESAVMEKRVDNHGGSTGVYQVASSWGRGSHGNGGAAGGRKVTGATRGGAGAGRGASGRGGRHGPGAAGAGRGRGAYGSAAGCKTCGGSHDSNTCKFKAYVCRVCNRDGHLKRMCPRLREEQLFALYDGGADGQVAFKEVFEDGLGRFTGGKVGFALREGARPVFLRARPLPYALREPVERALDQLVRDGIITPVPTSDWATPVVPEQKKAQQIASSEVIPIRLDSLQFRVITASTTAGEPEPVTSNSELRAAAVNAPPLPVAPAAPPTLPVPVEGPKPIRSRKPVKRYGFDFD
ncbi:uncharacterized protein LOC134677778 [Cydia fagiglandana]|uniref:uncharacterized protein LOC134677778 n=1 Tax=Cydia fagiglandana TaxID=1458189 RepID=UPI002FEE0977